MKLQTLKVTRVAPYIGDKNKVLINLDNLDWVEPRVYDGKLGAALYFAGKILIVTETVDDIEGMLP